MAKYNIKKDTEVWLVNGGTSPVYFDNYPISGLVHHWKLDNDTTGTKDYIDSTLGSNQTEGTIAFNSDVLFPNYTGSFESTSTNGIRVLTSNEANLWEDENDEWSLSFWFKSTAADGSYGPTNRLISREIGEGFGITLNQTAASGSQTLKVFGKPTNVGATISAQIATNTWYNVVLVFDGTYIDVYLNGVLYTNDIPYTRGSSPGGLAVGHAINDNDLDNGNTFRGRVSDLRLWNRALSSAEASSLVNFTQETTATKLEIGPDITFGQTFTDSSTSVKTLHSQDFFERANISKANPANFTFKIPVFAENDLQIVHDRLLDCGTFDLYISTQQDVFRLQKCVIKSGTYEIERSTPLTLAISGSASKLSKVGEYSSYSLPGVAQSITSGRQHLQPLEVTTTLNSVDISSETVSINIELQNEVSWNQNKTVQGGMTASSRANATYPENFTISKKVLSGSIQRYLCDSNNSDVNDYDEDATLRIKVGETISGSFYGFDFNMPACSFTNRSSVADLYTQNYDWRLTDNSQSLSTTITYNNI